MKLYNMIMLIDDRNLISFTNQHIFMDSGIADEVVVEPTGDSALEYLKKNKYNDYKIPELIIIETGSKAWDTFEFLKQFNQLPKNIRQRCEITIFTNGKLIQKFDQWIAQYAMYTIEGPIKLNDLAGMTLGMN